MNKEEIIERLRHGSKVVKDGSIVVKDFVVKQYHRFADFLAEKKSEGRKNGCFVIFGMRCTKYVFVLMNIFYLLMALFMIFMGTSSYLALQSFYDLLWFDVQVLSAIWIISGVVLAFISVFEIIAAFKESISWSNIYGVLLLITFFLQMITSIAAFCLVATGSTEYHSSNLVDQLMRNYFGNSDSAQKMDYIQSKFHCCGERNPGDWDTLGKLRQDSGRFVDYPLSRVTESITSTTTPPIKYKTPASCCTAESSYQNNTCDSYYETGCTGYVHDFVTETILIIASVLLVIGVLQILGMVVSFMLARLFRQASTYRNVRKFNSQYRNIFDVPTNVDYRPLHNSTDRCIGRDGVSQS